LGSKINHVHDQDQGVNFGAQAIEVNTRGVEALGDSEDVALTTKNVVTTTIIATTTIRHKCNNHHFNQNDLIIYVARVV
jgi:hypothetical protein